MADQPLYKNIGKELQQKTNCCKELVWPYQTQCFMFDKDCFQQGLDFDRKHASIAHHRAMRESTDATAKLWLDALVCWLWSGLVCLNLVCSDALVCSWCGLAR